MRKNTPRGHFQSQTGKGGKSLDLFFRSQLRPTLFSLPRIMPSRPHSIPIAGRSKAKLGTKRRRYFMPLHFGATPLICAEDLKMIAIVNARYVLDSRTRDRRVAIRIGTTSRGLSQAQTSKITLAKKGKVAARLLICQVYFLFCCRLWKIVLHAWSQKESI